MEQELTIEEMEQAMYGAHTEEGPANPESDEPSKATSEEKGKLEGISVELADGDLLAGDESETIDTTISPETTSEAAPQSVTDEEEETYKKRFKNFKPKADATIFNLRTELSKVKAECAKLLKSVGTLQDYIQTTEKKSTVVDLPQETKDYLGEEGVNAIQQTVDAAVDPFKKKLKADAKKEQEKLIREANDLATQANNSFFSILGAKVPDYAEVNVAPDFIKFLTKKDPVSGYTYSQLFKMAEDNGDADGVANFFITFKKGLKTKKSKAKEELDSNISPTSSASNSSSSKQSEKGVETWTEQAIENFYDDAQKGKYTVDEANEIEARIDKYVFG